MNSTDQRILSNLDSRQKFAEFVDPCFEVEGFSETLRNGQSFKHPLTNFLSTTAPHFFEKLITETPLLHMLAYVESIPGFALFQSKKGISSQNIIDAYEFSFVTPNLVLENHYSPKEILATIVLLIHDIVHYSIGEASHLKTFPESKTSMIEDITYSISSDKLWCFTDEILDEEFDWSKQTPLWTTIGLHENPLYCAQHPSIIADHLREKATVSKKEHCRLMMLGEAEATWFSNVKIVEVFGIDEYEEITESITLAHIFRSLSITDENQQRSVFRHLFTTGEIPSDYKLHFLNTEEQDALDAIVQFINYNLGVLPNRLLITSPATFLPFVENMHPANNFENHIDTFWERIQKYPAQTSPLKSAVALLLNRKYRTCLFRSLNSISGEELLEIAQDYNSWLERVEEIRDGEIPDWFELLIGELNTYNKFPGNGAQHGQSYPQLIIFNKVKESE